MPIGAKKQKINHEKGVEYLRSVSDSKKTSCLAVVGITLVEVYHSRIPRVIQPENILAANIDQESGHSLYWNINCRKAKDR